MKTPYTSLFILLIITCLYSCVATQPTVQSSSESSTNADYVENTTNSSKEYISPNFLRYEDYTYKNNINSAQLFIKGDPLSMPVVFLNDNKQLSLHFDDMNSSFKTYSYKFIHCNANWEPSSLSPSEYIQGYFSGYIDEYVYSFNTLYSYIHYSMDFPNSEISFSKSGNYIIKVYANNNEDDLILTRRFYVVDRKVSIQPKIKMATLARYRDSKQEVDFNLILNNYPVRDPYQDIKVVISQNGRWDNAITNLKPIFVRSNELVYDYEEGNLFDGNNEYRYFDAKDLRYQSMNVEGIHLVAGKTNLYVIPEEPRSYKRYYSQDDINGKRLIKRDDSRDSNREADYMNTHFTLHRSEPITDGDVYVFGELSGWQFKEDFKMKYVAIDKEYRLSVKLKQGYYNYMYAVLPKNETKGDLSIIEGTHSETENDYYFFVYHRKSGEIYDRLVGFSKSNSVKSID